MTDQGLEATVDAASHIARFTAEDPCARPATSEWFEFNPVDLDLFHPNEVSIDQETEIAKGIESHAIDTDARIVSVDPAQLTMAHVALATSENFFDYSP